MQGHKSPSLAFELQISPPKLFGTELVEVVEANSCSPESWMHVEAGATSVLQNVPNKHSVMRGGRE